MKGKEKSAFDSFQELHPAIQALLVLSVLTVLILIYMNPPASSGIVAFLLALKSLWSGGSIKNEQREDEKPPLLPPTTGI